jgi:hypothetical protein
VLSINRKKEEEEGVQITSATSEPKYCSIFDMSISSLSPHSKLNTAPVSTNRTGQLFYFILWLAIHDRLTTGDWLLVWDFKGDVNCSFCRAGIESRNHLFFSCGFSSRVWKTCLQWCGLLNCYTSWSELIDEGCRTWKSKSLMGTICRLILSYAVYWLWWARNELKVGGQPLIEE